ncbi:MAG: hypothetical protein Q7U43_12805 [Methylococcaceae bacterium]|nr:hypothetical protein [Methylococcaceae bacterium]
MKTYNPYIVIKTITSSYRTNQSKKQYQNHPSFRIQSLKDKLSDLVIGTGSFTSRQKIFAHLMAWSTVVTNLNWAIQGEPALYPKDQHVKRLAEVEIIE